MYIVYWVSSRTLLCRTINFFKSLPESVEPLLFLREERVRKSSIYFFFISVDLKRVLLVGGEEGVRKGQGTGNRGVDNKDGMGRSGGSSGEGRLKGLSHEKFLTPNLMWTGKSKRFSFL